MAQGWAQEMNISPRALALLSRSRANLPLFPNALLALEGCRGLDVVALRCVLFLDVCANPREETVRAGVDAPRESLLWVLSSIKF